MPQIRVTPSGVMDKDTDLQYVGQGNYVDANDIRHRQLDGNNFGGIMSIPGNILTNTIPDYTATSKKYRIYIDVSKIADGSITANEGSLFLENSTGTVFSNTSLNISDTNLTNYITTLKGFFNSLSTSAYVGNFTYSSTTNTGTFTAFFDLTTALDTDFILTVDNTNGTLCNIKLIEEYIASGGTFKVIGSQQIENYLFVYLAGAITSEIGVIYSTNNDVSFTYVRLIRSKKFTFSSDRRVECELERNGSEINLYWTDGLNKPRVLYLNYSLITTTDAFLFSVGGRYELETVDLESSFFYRTPSSYLDEITVIQGGGNITAGNKRYTGRFLTEDFVSTEFLYPTNPVNIYLSSFSKPSKIAGNLSDELTDKSVSMVVKNIIPGIYRYFELVAIEYVERVYSAAVVQRFELQDNTTELSIEHSGRGQELIPVSANELLAIVSKYLSVQSMRLFDSRMVISNLTEQTDLNLSTFAQTLTHSIHQKYVKGQGTPGVVVQSEPAYAFGEYQDPNNVLNFVGYMINDTYRFGLQVKWKNTGKWSSSYWVDDIRIDDSTTNVVGSRRTMLGGSISSVNLGTDVITINNHGFVEGDEIKVSVTSGLAGIVSGFTYNANVLSNNTFKLTEIIFGVVTPVDITTSGTGTVTISPIDANLTTSNSSFVKAYHLKFHNFNLNTLIDTTGDNIGDTPLRNLIEGFRIVRSERIPEVITTGIIFRSTTGAKTSSGLTWFTPQGVLNDVIRVGGGSGTQRVFFYSPDFYFKYSYSFQSGLDKLKIVKPFDRSNMIRLAGLAEGSTNSFYQDMPGYFADRNTASFSYIDFAVTAHTHLDLSGEGALGVDNVALNTDSGIVFPSTEVFKLQNVIPAMVAPFATNEFGHYYAQIFRDLGGNKKYPINKELSTYYGVGHVYYLSSGENGTINNIGIFGGDVFTQKSHMKLHMTKWQNPLFGLGSSWSFYSQNRVNSQMMNVLDHDNSYDGPGYVYPQQLDKTQGGTFSAGSWQSGVIYWTEQWPEVTNQNNFDESYVIQSDGIPEQGYNTNLRYNGSLPTRIAYSAKKVLGSQKDNYRLFKPIDFSDLDLTKGPLVHHEVLNGNFYTFQPLSVQRQYFRDASLIGAQEGTDIVIGSGSILGSPAQEINAIGLFKKWSQFKGKNQTGKDTFYWYNDQLQKICRFGDDGTRVISDKGLASFLINNGKFVSSYDYALSGFGVHGTWNDKYNEAIFTFKYNDGVSNKQFTLVYDEIKNGFIGFHSYFPNIYLPYKNNFFSTNPASQKILYLHDRGSDSTFYGSFVAPSITAVMNFEPNGSKNFEALQFVTDKVPFDVYLNTTNHTSYLEDTDFEKREDFFYSHIKNDSTGTGLNNGDTSRLWGKWLKVKMTFEASVGKQKLINFIVKFRAMARLYNQ